MTASFELVEQLRRIVKRQTRAESERFLIAVQRMPELGPDAYAAAEIVRRELKLPMLTGEPGL